MSQYPRWCSYSNQCHIHTASVQEQCTGTRLTTHNFELAVELYIAVSETRTRSKPVQLTSNIQAPCLNNRQQSEYSSISVNNIQSIRYSEKYWRQLFNLAWSFNHRVEWTNLIKCDKNGSKRFSFLGEKLAPQINSTFHTILPTNWKSGTVQFNTQILHLCHG